MKITIVTGAFLPVPAIRGGAVEKRWYALAREFCRSGHEVTLLSRRHSDLPNEETETCGLQHVRVRGATTPSSVVRLKWRDLHYSRRVYRALPDSDIVVTNTFWLPILCRGRLARKVVVDQARMPKGQMRFYRHARWVRANSSAVRDAILEECPRLEPRVGVIPNPLPFEAHELSLERPEKRKTILYAGRLHPEKGLELLLEAFRWFAVAADAAGWRLVVAGSAAYSDGGGGEGFLRRLTEMAEGLAVEFPGRLGGASLEQAYREAELFAYPSIAYKGETFGLAPLEGMAFGAVPVVSRLRCFQDFIRHEENGWIANEAGEGAAEAFGSAFARLAADAEWRDRLGRRAMEVQQTHSAERIARQFVAAFETASEPR